MQETTQYCINCMNGLIFNSDAPRIFCTAKSPMEIWKSGNVGITDSMPENSVCDCGMYEHDPDFDEEGV